MGCRRESVAPGLVDGPAEGNENTMLSWPEEVFFEFFFNHFRLSITDLTEPPHLSLKSWTPLRYFSVCGWGPHLVISQCGGRGPHSLVSQWGSGTPFSCFSVRGWGPHSVLSQCGGRGSHLVLSPCGGPGPHSVVSQYRGRRSTLHSLSPVCLTLTFLFFSFLLFSGPTQGLV